MTNLFPNSNIRDKLKEGLEIIKFLKPCACENHLNETDYDSLESILIYFQKFFSDSKPFCVECRHYYGLNTGYQCDKCKIGVGTYFTKLKKDDFKHYRVYHYYKGKLFTDYLPKDRDVVICEPITLTPKEKMKQYMMRKYDKQKNM